MDETVRDYWLRYLCLRCRGEFICKAAPQLCPFCLAGTSLLADRYKLEHRNPGTSDECPGENLRH